MSNSSRFTKYKYFHLDKSADIVEEKKTYRKNENFQESKSETYIHSETAIDGLENSHQNSEFSKSIDKKEQVAY